MKMPPPEYVKAGARHVHNNHLMTDRDYHTPDCSINSNQSFRRSYGTTPNGNTLHRSHNALGAFLRKKKTQLGVPKAITATAHKLARIIYSMLKYGQKYVDAGPAYYERQHRQRALRNAKRRTAQLGYRLVAITDGHNGTSSQPIPETAVAPS